MVLVNRISYLVKRGYKETRRDKGTRGEGKCTPSIPQYVVYPRHDPLYYRSLLGRYHTTIIGIHRIHRIHRIRHIPLSFVLYPVTRIGGVLYTYHTGSGIRFGRGGGTDGIGVSKMCGVYFLTHEGILGCFLNFIRFSIRMGL